MDRHSLITIVGGSGFLGRYVVQELVKTGARLRIVVRNPSKAQFLKPLGGLGQVQIVAGDIRSDAAMAAACEGATAVVNLVGILGESGGQTFDAVQAAGAGRVARAAAAAGVRAFVQMSAIGADTQSRSAYGRTKGEGEAAVRAAFPQATILRPSIVFGPEDGFLNRFAGLAKIAPFVLPIVAAGTRFQPVYVLDVARCVAAALADPARFGGQTYELGGPRALTMRELIAYILAETRVSKPIVEIPDAVAGTAASLFGWLPGAPLTADQWTMLQSDNVVSGENGLTAFGIGATPLEAIAPAYLVRYRRQGRWSTGGVTVKGQSEG